MVIIRGLTWRSSLGFSGDLQLGYETIQDLDLVPTDTIKAQLASNEVVDVPRAFSVASLENVTHPVEILVSGGTPLVGIGLLIKFGYKATINCRRKTASLELAT